MRPLLHEAVIFKSCIFLGNIKIFEGCLIFGMKYLVVLLFSCSSGPNEEAEDKRLRVLLKDSQGHNGDLCQGRLSRAPALHRCIYCLQLLLKNCLGRGQGRESFGGGERVAARERIGAACMRVHTVFCTFLLSPCSCISFWWFFAGMSLSFWCSYA